MKHDKTKYMIKSKLIRTPNPIQIPNYSKLSTDNGIGDCNQYENFSQSFL